MKSNKEFMQAKENFDDLQERGAEAVGSNALEFIDAMLTNEEKTASDLRVALIGEFIKARQEKGLTQRDLEELSGVKQPVIARIENGTSVPNLNTIIKMLVPLGKTLYIGDLKK